MQNFNWIYTAKTNKQTKRHIQILVNFSMKNAKSEELQFPKKDPAYTSEVLKVQTMK